MKNILFWIFSALFSAIVVLSHLIAVEFVSVPFFPDLAVPGGLLIYPFTFIVSNLTTEIYGERKARFLIYLGFGLGALSYLMIQLAMQLPTHANQLSFEPIFGIQGLILISCTCAYAIAQLLGVHLFAFLKELTKCKHLWLRNVGSALTSQIVDTLVVNTLLLHVGLNFELSVVIKISLLCYLIKALFTVSHTPILYLAVKLTKQLITDLKQPIQLPHLEPDVKPG